jgi:hypothetical protein
MSTFKQKLAMKKMLENGGVVSRAMADSGYSPAMAKNPQKLTTTKGWQELMDEFLPDSKIIKKINEGLEATRIHTSHTEPDRIVPDYNVQHKFVETSLKIKGKLDTNNEDPPSLTFNFYGNRLRPNNTTPSKAESST